MSGGRNDAAAIAIAHQEQRGRIVIDRVDSVAAPFNPEEAIERFALVMSAYGLRQVYGDNYSAEFVVAAFSRHGVSYLPAELSKSDIYGEVLPLFTAQLVELPDVPQLEGQLRQLERRPRASGHDAIDHPKGSHDDLANACCGALWMASRQPGQSRDDGSNITHAARDHDPWAPVPEIRPSARNAHLLPANLQGRYEPDYSQSLRDHDSLN